MTAQHTPGIDDVAKARADGANAGTRGMHFKSDCPYTYDKFPGMSYQEFDEFKRPLMNAWFNGWKANYRRPDWVKRGQVT